MVSESSTGKDVDVTRSSKLISSYEMEGMLTALDTLSDLELFALVDSRITKFWVFLSDVHPGQVSKT